MPRGKPGLVALAVALVLIAVPFDAEAQTSTAPAGPAVASPAGDQDPEADPDTVVVRFRPGLSYEDSRSVAAEKGLRAEKPIGATGHVLVSTQGKTRAAALRSLRADRRVAHAEPNWRRRVAAVPNDPGFATHQGYLTNLGLPTAWDRSTGSSTVRVAVLDTGVDLDHPEFLGRILPGWDFVTADPIAEDGNGHGTLVAGVAAARTHNGQGVAGVGWDASIIPVKVLDDQGSGYDSDVAAGITWAADNGAKVANLSLGGPADSSVLRSAVSYALSKDVVVVAAAGNECSSSPSYPSAYPGVVSVSATDHDGKFAGPPYYPCDSTAGPGPGFSNSGPWVSLSAPGMSITSTAMGTLEKYATASGTSFSAPIVSGVAVLLRAQQPGWSQSQVVDRLRATARDAGSPGFDDQHGYGWVDPTAALGGTPYPPLNSPAEGELHALPPARVLDTRNGTGGVSGPAGPGQSFSLRVTGVGGVPASGVSAVVMNVTATQPTASSFLAVHPAGEARPLASNLNFLAGQTVPNLVQVKVGAGGSVTFYNQAGYTHVVADVAGWYSDASGTRGARFHPLVPSRVLDTRQEPGGAVGPGQVKSVLVAGRGGLPSSGVSSVVMNVTATQPTAESFLTVFPPDASRPLASNLNYLPNQTVPNLVMAKVAPDGTVSAYNNAGYAHVIFDVVGWYSTAADPPGALLRPVSPARILDTRNGTGAAGPVGPGRTINVLVAGRGGVPPSGVSSVVMNVTATQPTAESFLTVFPPDASRPLASNLNYLPNQTVPNLVVAKVAPDGTVSAYNNAGYAHVIFDVFGWFTG